MWYVKTNELKWHTQYHHHYYCLSITFECHYWISESVDSFDVRLLTFFFLFSMESIELSSSFTLLQNKTFKMWMEIFLVISCSVYLFFFYPKDIDRINVLFNILHAHIIPLNYLTMSKSQQKQTELNRKSHIFGKVISYNYNWQTRSKLKWQNDKKKKYFYFLFFFLII